MASVLPGLDVGSGDRDLKKQDMGNQRIKSLDGLRALSIFIVLAAHVAETVHLRHDPYTRFVSNVGSFGVKIFFVISGFSLSIFIWKQATAGLWVGSPPGAICAWRCRSLRSAR